ncbi:c-type cytochrome [Sulfuricystis multivorans]|uniref:c-type cytochrome n=1 Tax=Sulfuricystis multivorans TaxID=2211108 RepID=UPI000F84D2B8|nr:c-type cytochrome [Sulfuricystis multivorans]
MMQNCFARRLALAGLVVIPTIALAMGSTPKAADEEAANLRIQPVAKVKLAPLSAAGAAKGSRSGEELYKAVCSACHEAGVAGAPKAGDKAAWGPRIAQGYDALVASAKAGKGAMPPKGGSDATDEELARAVAYLANKAGANF